MSELIDKIKNIKEVDGWFTTGLNIKNEEIDYIVNNIKTREEIESLPSFLSKYMTKNQIDKLFSNELSNYIKRDFVENIPQNTVLSLDYKTFQKFTDIQAVALGDINLYKLNRNDRLMELNNNALCAIINKLDLTEGHFDNILPTAFIRLANDNKLHNYSAEKISQISKETLVKMDSKVLTKLTNQQLSKLPQNTINYIIQNSKLHHFSDEFIQQVGQNLSFNYSNTAGITNILSFGFIEQGNDFENIRRQVNLLCYNNKIHLLSPKSLSTLDNYLIQELNKNNIANFSAEQLNAIANRISYVNEEALSGIDISIIKELNNTVFNKITNEQIEHFSQEQILSLIQNNKLHLLSGNCIKLVIQTNFDSDFIKQIKDDNLIQQINSFNNDFFKYITQEQLTYFNPNIFTQINLEQFKSITAEQLNFIHKHNNEIIKLFPNNFVNNITDEEFYKLNDDVLQNLSVEQISLINNNKINHLVKNNKLILLNNDVIKAVNNKINFTVANNQAQQINDLNKEQKLETLSLEAVSTISINKIADELDNDTLHNISNLNVKTKTYEDNIEKTESVLNRDIIDKYDEIYKTGKLKQEDIDSAISDYIKKEDYKKLEINCIEWSKNKEYKPLIVNSLYKKLKECKNNIYGNIDKIEILKLLTLTEVDTKRNENNYKLLEDTIKKLSELKPETIDGHISKIKEFSKLTREGSFDIDFLEMMAQENLKNMDKCIKTYYSKIERNSLDNSLKDVYADILIDYANIISQKYKIDVSKFENELNEIDERNLTKEERLYFETIKKAFEYKPDIESAVKSWVTPILKTAIKGIGAYFATKTVAKVGESNTLTAVAGVVGAGVITKDIVDEYGKKKYFLNQESCHKEEREKEDGILKKIWKGTKTVTYYSLAHWWLKPTKSIVKAYKKHRGYELIGFDNDKRNKSIGLRSNSFKKNTIKEYFYKTKINLKEKHQKDFDIMDEELSKLKTKEVKIIKDFISLKAKAIDIEAKRKINELYKDYPEFNESGILNKLLKIKNIAGQISKGVISSIFDVATLGYGSDLYKKFVGNTTGEEKIKREARFSKFKEQLNKINNETCDRLNKLKKEEVRRLGALNEQDLNIVKEVGQKQKTEKHNLENEFNSFLTNNEIKNKLYDFYEMSNIDDGNIKIDSKIIKRINKTTGILKGIEKFSKSTKNFDKNFQEAYNQTISLMVSDNIDDKELLANNLNAMLEITFEMVDKGCLGFEEDNIRQLIVPLLAGVKICEQTTGQGLSKVVEEKYKSVKKVMDSRFVDLVEKRSNLKRLSLGDRGM